MESKELYRHLLGLVEPWAVERVELNMERQQVDIYVGEIYPHRFILPKASSAFAPHPDGRVSAPRQNPRCPARFADGDRTPDWAA